MREIDEVTGEVIDAAFRIHWEIGPGLLESVYESILAATLTKRGLAVEQQKPISFDFDGLHFDDAGRVDLLVESRVVVELKSVEKLIPVHGKQVLTYLRLLKLPVGLLMNFGAARFKDGLQRIVNAHIPTPASMLRVNRPRS
jgi:iron complex transport system substrate-binding protein